MNWARPAIRAGPGASLACSTFALPAAEYSSASGIAAEVRRPWRSRGAHAKDRLVAVPSKEAAGYRSLALSQQIQIIHFARDCRFVESNLGMNHGLSAKHNFGFHSGIRSRT